MTGKYLDTTGLSYLWDKITAAFASKEQLTGSINNKVDKISSYTDNAVVRFNGTSSAIQNSGVTINDSNHVTAAKFITSGGTSSKFVKGDGSLDTHNYMKIKKLPTSGTYISQSSCYLKLVMPNPLSSWMMTLGIAVYSGYTSEIYYIGGYNYQSSTKTWHSPSVILLSSSTSSKNVYFGKNDYDGGDGKLWVAIPLSSYSHVSLMENSNNGYVFDIADIEYSTLDANPDNWDTTTLGTINHTRTVTSSSGYLPLSGGLMSGKITFPAKNTEILHFAGTNDTWGAGLRYSWSNKTAIAFWGQHAETAFIWNAGTNYASTDIPSTGTNYDFKIQRISGTPKVSTTGDFVGNSFIKSGGTSSQFLKADGSVDSNTYLTTAPVTSVNGKTGAVTLTIPSKTSDLTNDSNFIQDKGRSSSSSSTSIIDGAFSNEDIVLTCNNHNAAVNVNPMGVDIIANWNGGSNGVNNNGTSNVNINTSQGKAYYNNKEIATVDQIVTPPVTSVNGQTGAVTLSIPAAVTESTVAGWGFTKNVGTITGVTGSNGLTGSGTSGSVTISHAAPSTSPAKTTQAVYPIKIDQYGHITSVGTAVTIPTVPTNVSAFTNDAGYATDMNLSTISSSSTSATLSNTNTYYRHLSTGIGTLNITLPDVSSATKVQHIMLYIKTGSSPTLNVTSSGSATITYVDGFEIEASKEYEISFLWNGAKWIVAYNTLAS